MEKRDLSRSRPALWRTPCDGKDRLKFRVEMSEDGKRWDRAVDGDYRRR